MMKDAGFSLGMRVLALAALALATPAAAQQGGMIAAFDANVLSTAITAVGGRTGPVRNEDGKAYYTFTLPSGIPAVAYFDDCEGQACKTLVLISSLEMPAGRTVAQLDELLRTVNNNVPAAKVFRVDQRVVMQHYVLADFGISPANVQEHLRVFSNVTLSMYQTLNPQPQQPAAGG